MSSCGCAAQPDWRGGDGQMMDGDTPDMEVKERALPPVIWGNGKLVVPLFWGRGMFEMGENKVPW